MARYSAGHKQESLSRFIRAAGRGFRRHGFSGIGIDDLAKEAGVTHGAFYSHFRSKSDAFQAAIVAGLHDLRDRIITARELYGDGWIEHFVEFYLGQQRTCDAADGCTVASLSAEIERSDTATRSSYQTGIEAILAAIADGLTGDSSENKSERACVLLATLSGGVTLARAMPDVELSKKLSNAISRAAVAAAMKHR